MQKTISVRLTLSCLLISFCLYAQQQPNTAPMLFPQPSATDDALSAQLQQTAYHQKPELVSTLIRLNLEQRLGTTSDYLTKRAVALRYASSVKACLDLPSNDQMACVSNLFDTLQPDMLIQLALIDGGHLLNQINQDIVNLYVSLLKTGTRAQKNEAAQRMVALLEKYGQGINLTQGPLLIPAMLNYISQATAHAELFSKNITTGKRDLWAHTVAQALIAALTYHLDYALIQKIIAENAAHKVVFSDTDRTALGNTIPLYQNTNNNQHSQPWQRLINKLDQALHNMHVVRDLYDTQNQDLFNFEAYLRKLDPIMRSLALKSSEASVADTMQVVQQLIALKQTISLVGVSGKKVSAYDASIFDAWLQANIIALLEHVVRSSSTQLQQKELQGLVKFVLSNIPLTSPAAVSLYLACVKACLRFGERPLAYDVMRFISKSELFLEDRQLLEQYRTIMQRLFEQEVEHEDMHLISNTLKHLIKPNIANLLKLKMDAQAMYDIMQALKTLRIHTAAPINKNTFLATQQTLMELINERLLDVATTKDVEALKHDLAELAQHKTINQKTIKRLSESLNQRKEQPYLNNSVMRWMLNGLSRRKVDATK